MNLEVLEKKTSLQKCRSFIIILKNSCKEEIKNTSAKMISI
jgi:hypothetical protein